MSDEFRREAIKGLMSDIEIVLSPEYREKREWKEHPEWNLGSVAALAQVECLFNVLKKYVEV